VTDGVWFRHRERVCARFPQLAPLFDTKSKKKRRKTVSFIPHSGTWWTFAHRLALGCDMIGFRKAMKEDSTRPLMDAVLRHRVCKPETWDTAYVAQERTEKRWFISVLHSKLYRNYVLQFHVAPVHRLMKATIRTTGYVVQPVMRERDMYYNAVQGRGVAAPQINPLSLPDLYFEAWTAFLCDLPHVALQCTERFAEFTQ
jgi:hypothetical protein